MQYLKDEVRFERAKDLLLQTTKSIKQVAAASGFRNEKRFMRASRESIGTSPDNFRAKQNKDRNGTPAMRYGKWNLTTDTL